ncbi:MAG: hypothetical protein AB7T59_14570 [Hyphomonadaceae bacterium]
MGGASGKRTALLAGGALVATLLGVSMAAAQETLAPETAPAPAEDQSAIGDIDLVDPQTVLRRGSVSVRGNVAERFAPPAAAAQGGAEGPRRVELEFAAGDGALDVSFAQRASIGSGSEGDIDRQGRGSEVRIGRNLVEEREGERRGPSTYLFVASDNEALTWQPSQRSEFGGRGSSFSLQDQVEVGDMSVGVTYENNGVQASLAYVEREESVTVGSQGFKQDESFAGVTLTMRR